MVDDNSNMAEKDKSSVLLNQFKDAATAGINKINASAAKQYIIHDLTPKMASMLGKAGKDIYSLLRRQVAKINENAQAYTDEDPTLRWNSVEASDEGDLIVWTFSFLLKNGHHHEMVISGADKYRLERIITERSKLFAVFDTAQYSVALKVPEIIYWQFLIAPPYMNNEKQISMSSGEKLHMNLWFSSFQNSRAAYVDKDSTNSFDDPDQTPLRNLLIALDTSVEENEVFETTDENGEKIYLRGTALCMITIPLEALGHKVSASSQNVGDVVSAEDKKTISSLASSF
ncbi:MAG: hypothetical protein ACKOW3_04985 [Hyphomicrobium sp.]